MRDWNIISLKKRAMNGLPSIVRRPHLRYVNVYLVASKLPRIGRCDAPSELGPGDLGALPVLAVYSFLSDEVDGAKEAFVASISSFGELSSGRCPTMSQ